MLQDFFLWKNCKYSTSHLYNDYKVIPLQIIIPKTSGYISSYYGQTKWIYFVTEDVDLLKIYRTIRDIFRPNIEWVSPSIKIFFWKLK